MALTDLRQFLSLLEREGEIVTVEAEVDPTLEVAEIHRRVAAADGPALFFRHVKGSSFPIVTNLFGSSRRVRLAFGQRPEEMLRALLHLFTRDFPPTLSTLWKQRHLLKSLPRIGQRRRRKGPVAQVDMAPLDLEKLPLLQLWPHDGGHFLTLPLVYTEPPSGGSPNLGIYRMQRYDKTKMGMHWQIGKGGGFHYHCAEQEEQPLPVTVFLGGPPALLLAAIAPLPENIPELLLASFLQGSKLHTLRDPSHPHPLLAHCEFALLGTVLPQERRGEGPFGDHYGYYSLRHDFPVFHCQRLTHRQDAIYPATVVGKPRQEDYYIGEFLQELLSPLFPLAMPGVVALWSYGETGFHPLCAAVVQERYAREGMVHAFRILGEGQLSLTKFLLLTDQRIDVRNVKQVLTTVLERFCPETDLFIFSNLCLDTLDYTGPAWNLGSRGVLLGMGKKIRDLPHTYSGALPRPLRKIIPFCPGCLVLELSPGETDFASLLSFPDFSSWPLLFLVDDAAKATQSEAAFLWTIFTRFEPAADIHSTPPRVARHHLCYQLPLLINARMKPGYPPEVRSDEVTAARVTQRWQEYFPQGLEMGNSDTGHVY